MESPNDLPYIYWFCTACVYETGISRRDFKNYFSMNAINYDLVANNMLCKHIHGYIDIVLLTCNIN